MHEHHLADTEVIGISGTSSCGLAVELHHGTSGGGTSVTSAVTFQRFIGERSFNLFTWSDELDPTSLSAEEEAAKVVAETKAYQEITDETSKTQPKKKQKLTHTSEHVLKPEQEEYRRLLDTHEKWEEELSTVHGLSKAEAGLVCDVVTQHGQSESFPKEDPKANSKHLQLARPGWEQFRSIMACFQEHVLPTGWHHKKDPETGEWTVVKMGAH